jgi:hypothetical protein
LNEIGNIITPTTIIKKLAIMLSSLPCFMLEDAIEIYLLQLTGLRMMNMNVSLPPVQYAPATQIRTPRYLRMARRVYALPCDAENRSSRHARPFDLEKNVFWHDACIQNMEELVRPLANSVFLEGGPDGFHPYTLNVHQMDGTLPYTSVTMMFFTTKEAGTRSRKRLERWYPTIEHLTDPSYKLPPYAELLKAEERTPSSTDHSQPSPSKSLGKMPRAVTTSSVPCIETSRKMSSKAKLNEQLPPRVVLYCEEVAYMSEELMRDIAGPLTDSLGPKIEEVD